LAWSDGYYNGDIKTRKTTQPVEFKADQIGLQRSEQLRELYESLSADDNNQQTRRPSASLSAEDLTATEWYYLVCMSFTFSPGHGYYIFRHELSFKPPFRLMHNLSGFILTFSQWSRYVHPIVFGLHVLHI